MKILGVTESVQQRLRHAIITGELPPNHRLNEVELSEYLGVSRPPLREAFRKLENENLIISIPRKGSFVSTMSIEDCKQIYRTRTMLECTAVDIIDELGDPNLMPLKEILSEEMSFHYPKNTSKSDLFSYFKVMSKFHNQIVEMCRNNWIIHYHCQIRSALARYQVMYLKISGTGRSSKIAHQKIYDLLKQKKYQEAKEQINKHIYKTLNIITKALSDSHPSSSS